MSQLYYLTADSIVQILDIHGISYTRENIHPKPDFYTMYAVITEDGHVYAEQKTKALYAYNDKTIVIHYDSVEEYKEKHKPYFNG